MKRSILLQDRAEKNSRQGGRGERDTRGQEGSTRSSQGVSVQREAHPLKPLFVFLFLNLEARVLLPSPVSLAHWILNTTTVRSAPAPLIILILPPQAYIVRRDEGAHEVTGSSRSQDRLGKAVEKNLGQGPVLTRPARREAKPAR